MKLIAISAFQSEPSKDGPARACLNTSYVNAFTRPGTAAIIVPQFIAPYREFLTLDRFKLDFKPQIDRIVAALDAYVISGGRDLQPIIFDEANYASNGCDIIRDYTELALLDACIIAGKPVLGVCRGFQVAARYFGLDNYQQNLDVGELHQQIAHEMARHEPCHKVWTRGAFRTYLTTKLERDVHDVNVNSMHHQGLTLSPTGKFPGKEEIKRHGNFGNWFHHAIEAYEAKHDIHILATTPMVIEGFEKEEAKVVGWQSHPEESGPNGLMIQYFLDRYLADEAAD